MSVRGHGGPREVKGAGGHPGRGQMSRWVSRHQSRSQDDCGGCYSTQHGRRGCAQKIGRAVLPL